MKSSISRSVPCVRRLALGLVLSVLVGHEAAALPLTQSSPQLLFQDFVAVGTTLSAGDSFSGTFNIQTAGSGSTSINVGYANAGETFTDRGGYLPFTPLTSAKAYFYIRDANQGNDTLGLSLGGSQFLNSDTGSGSAFAILEGIADLSLLQTNGWLSYSISQLGTSRGSNFTVDYVQLQVVTAPEDNRVPDGGVSVAFLGAVLAGLVVLKRKNKI